MPGLDSCVKNGEYMALGTMSDDIKTLSEDDDDDDEDELVYCRSTDLSQNSTPKYVILIIHIKI